MQNRRKFIRTTLLGSAALASWNLIPLQALAGRDVIKLTILHTNDTHSRIEPFPENDPKYPGMGGAAWRAKLIEKIRQQEQNVLLFDAGDIFQGTPYFNFYGGELEFKLMSEMKYDAATIGNHDFDAGIEGLHKQLPHANFPFLCANYDFSDTIINGKTKPYKVFKKSGLKIGVFGLGVELEGLVGKKYYKETRYLDPVKKANETANILKNELKCDLVVCLSHLGYQYKGDKISDLTLVKQSANIDLILGGHTHTFLDKPTITLDKNGKEVLINQVGWAGVKLGKIDFYFDRRKREKSVDSVAIKVLKNQV